MQIYASRKNTNLPQVSIGDESIESSGWTWQDGWRDLVPARSNLQHAKDVLGDVCGISELANGFTYDFCSGLIRVSILAGSDRIAKIWIDRKAPQPFTPPSTIDEALSQVGKCVATAVNRLDGAIFERPGMRICCDAMQDSNPIKWMEIYCPIHN